ncbi:MAG: hypothetical protein B7C54_12365 [Acidimicrobiales bacterium mtb01]|nr:MAG: hypothetical protein B7C54_12365 [Acidimicrobiales bacterium mtb01]
MSVALLTLSIVLGGCITGERPRLVTDDTIPSIDDTAIGAVVDVLTAGFAFESDLTSFRVDYSVTTKFGGQSTTGSISVDRALGTSVQIAEVRFVFAADGSTATCSTTTSDCRPGIDETRVSDRMVNSRIFQGAIIDRLEQDAVVAVGDSRASTRTVADRPATCTTVPVVDSTGITREKSYCAFDELGVLAYLDTADLLIEATAVTPTADPGAFATS